MIFKEKESKEIDEKDSSHSNGGMLALAEAVSDGKSLERESKLSIEETGAAEELLALASEASLSSPIPRNELQTPCEKDIDKDKDNEKIAMNILTGCNSYGRRHVCNNCGVTSTPFWRKSHDGQYYCNACGLYLRTHNAMRPLSLSKNRESRRSKMRPESCANCGAADTPMWRKTEDGLTVCNACGLYHKLHGQHRKLGNRKSSLIKLNQIGESSLLKKEQTTRIKEENYHSNSAVKSINIISNHNRKVSTTNTNTNTKNNNNNNNNNNSNSNNSTNNLKYSLDAHFHHKFDPNRNSSTSSKSVHEIITPTPISFPISQDQPVDPRKLAYLKSSQGRTALLAPKISPLDHHPSHHQQVQQQSPYNSNIPYGTSSSVTPPILTNFINSLASTPAENLSLEHVEHPLQPLLTSIVSQKLKEQKRRSINEKITSPNSLINVNMNEWSDRVPRNNENELSDFIQNQQETIYNQQIIYNNSNGYRYGSPSNSTNGNTNNGTNGYNYYQEHARHPSNYYQANPFQFQQQINPQYPHQYTSPTNPQYPQINLSYPQNQHQHHQQQLQYNNNNNNNNNLQYPQYQHNPQYPQHQQIIQYPQQTGQYLNPEASYATNLNQHQSSYYNSEFASELPARQLSPFSGIKFDKSLIDLVNMQFWQDPNGTTNGNAVANYNINNEGIEEDMVVSRNTQASLIDDVIQDMPATTQTNNSYNNLHLHRNHEH